MFSSHFHQAERDSSDIDNDYRSTQTEDIIGKTFTQQIAFRMLTTFFDNRYPDCDVLCNDKQMSYKLITHNNIINGTNYGYIKVNIKLNVWDILDLEIKRYYYNEKDECEHYGIFDLMLFQNNSFYGDLKIADASFRYMFKRMNARCRYRMNPHIWKKYRFVGTEKMTKKTMRNICGCLSVILDFFKN